MVEQFKCFGELLCYDCIGVVYCGHAPLLELENKATQTHSYFGEVVGIQILDMSFFVCRPSVRCSIFKS